MSLLVYVKRLSTIVTINFGSVTLCTNNYIIIGDIDSATVPKIMMPSTITYLYSNVHWTVRYDRKRERQRKRDGRKEKVEKSWVTRKERGERRKELGHEKD